MLERQIDERKRKPFWWRQYQKSEEEKDSNYDSKDQEKKFFVTDSKHRNILREMNC